MAKQIQWFPGHMAKALKEMKESTKMVDIILELRDARIPLSSANPKIEEVVNQKPRLIVLTKDDLADKKETAKWLKYFESQGVAAISINMQKDSIAKIIDASNIVLKDKFERDRQRGMKKRPIKAMVVGIPNVGKSTLINRISNRKATVVGNTPGVTKKQQWIRIHSDMELLDTPGVLWPKFEDEQIGQRVALIGSIKETILPVETIYNYAYEFVAEKYPHYFERSYEFDASGKNEIEFSDFLASKRLLKGTDEQHERSMAQNLFLKELRDGRVGPITLDRVEEVEDANV